MTPSPAPASPDDDDPTRYVGLEAAEAEHRARLRGWSTLRRLPPGALITLEYLEGRLNLEVEEGRVRRAWKG
ncbi:I78 family peptidase inhibitor [Streptomyces sp. Isolate_45]|uniref:I78 family peptidase inhibitor n=1 Tax=unclassified Streptomyces TaxID=2593676 RepID=UPI002481AD82|nr:I78 family peptidase inhibitor [Streptomyces sp. Isolate_45]MDA5280148.1 I78 family peptidase inhibitor [Streptomyces sp. Isolate_45]